MSERTVTFEGAHGQDLTARLALPPDGKLLASALFAHGVAGSEDLDPARHVSRALTQAGIAVLRFEVSGRGHGEEAFDEATSVSRIDDLLAAAAYMEGELQGPAILVGHSLAGAAAIGAAGHIETCRAVATIGASYHPRMNETLAGLGRALMLFHSPVDQTVGMEHAAKLYTAARHPKSFVSLDGADHMLHEERDALYVGQVLAAWAGRYIDARPERAQSEEELASDNEVSVTTGSEGYVTEILARGHAIVADEPVAVGGSDLGPTPYDLLAAALGACTTMTLRMYAARKDWPLAEATVRLRHRKIHARDEEACEHRDARLDALEREVTLEGPLDEEQQARLMEIADRCPVHRTLSAGVVIETSRAS